MASSGSAAGSGIRFTNGKDAKDICIPQYREGFLRLMGGKEELLSFYNCGWGDEEVKALAKVLPLARSVTLLNLIENPKIGADGWRALAEAIAAGGAPQLIQISPCVVGLKSAWPTSDGGALKRACEARGILLNE